MSSTNNPNQQQRNFNTCNPKGPPASVNLDPAPPYCCPPEEENLRKINDDGALNWLKDETMKKTGFGARADCDPMITGNIINDPINDPNRTVIYRYSKSLRGTDEAIKDLFNTTVVIDEDGKAWPIPVILGPAEKAVLAIVQDNVRKDETLVVDRIKLPMIAITQTSIDYDMSRYTYHKATNLFLNHKGKPGLTIDEKYHKDTILGIARGIPVNIGYTITAWTMYREDMNQIVEQILTKFSPTAYIRVTGIPWEIIVTLDSIANNQELETSGKDLRVIKYEFNITTQTYIPQPIERKKAVLQMKVDFVNGLSEEEITKVMARIEESVKELKC